MSRFDENKFTSVECVTKSHWVHFLAEILFIFFSFSPNINANFFINKHITFAFKNRDFRVKPEPIEVLYKLSNRCRRKGS